MRGGSLGDRLRAGVRHTRGGGAASSAPPPLSPLQRADISAGTARGLAELHTQGIIHRDVKSTNILLDDECRPLVADMGLCRVLAPAATHTTTRRMGTDGYIDPEYSETLELREQSDVYSFGVVLLELISNQAAYTDGMNPPVRACGARWVCITGAGAGGRARAASAARRAGAPGVGSEGTRLCGMCVVSALTPRLCARAPAAGAGGPLPAAPARGAAH
jgi:serine/threonine protein kinase